MYCPKEANTLPQLVSEGKATQQIINLGIKAYHECWIFVDNLNETNSLSEYSDFWFVL
jgi:hypothetical protein